MYIFLSIMANISHKFKLEQETYNLYAVRTILTFMRCL